MMDLRKTETALAHFSIAVLVIYFPVETWVSLPYGLWNPFYLVDFIAMVLLLWGGVHSLRARLDDRPYCRKRGQVRRRRLPLPPGGPDASLLALHPGVRGA